MDGRCNLLAGCIVLIEFSSSSTPPWPEELDDSWVLLVALSLLELLLRYPEYKFNVGYWSWLVDDDIATGVNVCNPIQSLWLLLLLLLFAILLLELTRIGWPTLEILFEFRALWRQT